MRRNWMNAFLLPLAAVLGVAGTLACGSVAVAQPYGPPPPPGYGRPPPPPPPPPGRGYYWRGRHWHHRVWAFDRHHRGYWRYY